MKRSLMLGVITSFWIISAAAPIAQNIFLYLNGDIPKVAPIAVQYLVSPLIALVIAIATNVHASRLMDQFGVDNSQLGETIRFFRRVMKTSLLTIITKLCLWVSDRIVSVHG